jgi:hypothetical protein
VSLDCQAQGEVCSYVGTCMSSVVDTLGPNATPQWDAEGWLVFDLIDVHSDRTLTGLGLHLALVDAGQLTFLVYEWKNPGYELVREDATDVEGADAVFESHALAVPLLAGKRYMLGALMQAPGQMYLEEVTKNRRLSFGFHYGGTMREEGVEIDYHSVPSETDFNDYEPELHITTALPAQ